jgi:LysR family hydrogen peroxide-inducible transcriptional activator
VCGRLAVAAIPTVIPYWLAPKITSFQSRYPEVEVQLVENITARLIEGLQTGDLDLDLAIVSLPISFPDIVCANCFARNSYLCFPAGMPLQPSRVSTHAGSQGNICSYFGRVTVSASML